MHFECSNSTSAGYNIKISTKKITFYSRMKNQTFTIFLTTEKRYKQYMHNTDISLSCYLL